ncbi:MAG: O-acetyl-ADP-ribose deacetylase [Phycisphaerales bacterium]|nr:O-acetyl-ADP-ribose deacetylase [Phycisphaerales bacterium]
MLNDRIKIMTGDITAFTGDAIVNAANSTLLGGGGVDGAIHTAAGSQLLEACRTLGGCREGESKITPGFDLRSKHVIHTVGPYWEGGNHDESTILASCYQSSLELATRHDVRSIAFPAISCGVYGYPVDAASVVAICTTIDFLGSNDIPREVIFICFDESIHNAYVQALKNQS